MRKNVSYVMTYIIILVSFFAYFFLAATFTFGAQTDNTTRRFGIFIGANNGGRERVMLRYAVTDARSMVSVFSEMGGISKDDYVLLEEPSIRTINNHIDNMHQQVLRARGTNRRTEIVFYYSGHSDEEGLLLNREKYGYRELRDRINSIPSDMRIVILDSCASGAFTRLKGGERTLPFLLDSSFTAEGYAFLTSSSANEASQESDRIGASFFTHSLVAGLRGAADTVGDGRVTLNELYRYAYADTLARTETTLYGAQHPSYDIQISGTGDLVLTDVNQTSAAIVFQDTLTGRISIRNSRDQLVLELTKTVRPLELGLEPGNYRITLQQGNEVLRAEVTLVEGRRTIVTQDHFSSVGIERTRRRGGIDEETLPKTNLYTFFFNVVHEPFKLPLIGFVNFGIGNHIISQIGFFNLTTKGFDGFQAGFVNTVWGNFNGFQVSFTNTIAGNMNGFQAGFINTNAGDMKGFQAGFLNTNTRSADGFQAGFVNTNAGDFTGFQAGFLNTNTGKTDAFQVGFINTSAGGTKGLQTGFINTSAKEIIGGQIGFINTAPRGIKGTQIGFFNYAESIQGVPIGFITIVKNGGLKAVEYSFSEYYMSNVGLKFGTERFYTALNVAYNIEDNIWDSFAAGVSAGTIIPVIGNFLFINPEYFFYSPTLFGSLSTYSDTPYLFNSLAVYAGFNIGNLSLLVGPTLTHVQSFKYLKDDAFIPDPLFSFYTHDINDFHRLVIGGRIAVRLRW